MRNSDVTVLLSPLERVKALLSWFASHSQEQTKGKRAWVMFSQRRAHFHGVPVRSLFTDLLEEETDWIAQEKGNKCEYVGLLRKCMYGTLDASARWQTHNAQILKENEFVQRLSNPCSCNVGKDVRMLLHGDDFMVETHTLGKNGSRVSCSQSTILS